YIGFFLSCRKEACWRKSLHHVCEEKKFKKAFLLLVGSFLPRGNFKCGGIFGVASLCVSRYGPGDFGGGWSLLPSVCRRFEFSQSSGRFSFKNDGHGLLRE